jgi:hypothetical protein
MAKSASTAARRKPKKRRVNTQPSAKKLPKSKRKPSRSLTKRDLPGFGLELHQLFKRAGLGRVHLAQARLIKAPSKGAPPQCRMVEQPDGSFRIVCD